MQMEATNPSKTSVNNYQSPCRHISEDFKIY